MAYFAPFCPLQQVCDYPTLLTYHQVFCLAGYLAQWGGVPQYGEFRVMAYVTIYGMDGSTSYAYIPGQLFFT
jgi:hypothetical protein